MEGKKKRRNDIKEEKRDQKEGNDKRFKKILFSYQNIPPKFA